MVVTLSGQGPYGPGLRSNVDRSTSSASVVATAETRSQRPGGYYPERLTTRRAAQHVGEGSEASIERIGPLRAAGGSPEARSDSVKSCLAPPIT